MDRMLIGWEAIAKYLQVTVSTAKRYKHLHGMPVTNLPSYSPTITPAIIFDWLYKRAEIEKKRNLKAEIKVIPPIRHWVKPSPDPPLST